MADVKIKYLRYLGEGQHLLQDLVSGVKEVWFSNKDHASYGLIYKNTHLEFAREYKESLDKKEVKLNGKM